MLALPSRPDPMLCRQCSAELPDGSAFCNRCGTNQVQERPAQPFPAGSPGTQPAEETLWRGRYSLKAAAHLWLSWPLWMLLMLSLGLLRGSLPARFVPERFTLWLALLALLPGAWPLGHALVRKLSLRYRLTNHRLFTERGLLSRQHDELELIRIDDVSVRQTLLQRLLDVGTVTVLSTDASNPALAIEGIAHPLELKETIRAQVRARRARTTFLESL